MVLPNSNRPLGSILAMIVWGNELEIDLFLAHELL
jgi:hypothetical protein